MPQRVETWKLANQRGDVMEKQKTVVTGIVEEEETQQQPAPETEKPKDGAQHLTDQERQMEFPFTYNNL